MPGGWYFGTGRRKTAIARVRLRPGSGKFLVNDREANAYFMDVRDQLSILAPIQTLELTGKLDVAVSAHGGGLAGQAGAVRLGVARALVHLDSQHERKLRDGGFLTRDSRKVERKKYGRAGARRRFQFSKR